MFRPRRRTNVSFVFLMPLSFCVLFFLLQLLSINMGLVGVVPSTRSRTNTFASEFHHRTLLNSSDTKSDNNGQYPEDEFTLEQKRQGAVVLHIVGMCYMFLALAIACDEFFVPALAVITMKLNISEDVAGATFMAAGGSAPELFTSFIGMFADPNSNVGIGTIVGSAVFNVLFVIGMCAVFSRGVLKLTWWPLFRDCLFYSIAVLLLIWFFSDSLIRWWESLILLLAYGSYVTFMKFNHQVEAWVRSLLKPNRVSTMHLKVTTDTDNPAANRLSDFGLEKAVEHLLLQNSETQCFRYGALQLLTHTLDPLAESSAAIKVKELHTHRIKHLKSKVAVVTLETEIESKVATPDIKNQPAAEQKDIPNQIASTRDLQFSSLPNGELNGLPVANGDSNCRANSSDFNFVFQSSNDSSNLRKERKNSLFSNQDTRHSQLLSPDSKYTLKMKDTVSSQCKDQIQTCNGNAVSEKNSRQNSINNRTSTDSNYVSGDVPSVKIIQTESADSPPPGVVNDNDRLSGVSTPSRKSQTFITTSIGSQQYLVADENEEVLDLFDDDEPIDLSWPEGWKNQLFYLVKAPVLIPMYYTCLDVRREDRKNWYPWTFLWSIVWIGGFSYLMVWFAKLVGETFGIPTQMMGLTFIAAGTSIPDLITSVLVARKGFGDMAVSSSIGSNMFDITVGLPLPWIIYSAINSGKAAGVDKDKLFCSVALLFFMLIAVIVCIACSKWQMSKLLGALMFLLYVIFLIITILIQSGKIMCPLP